MDKIKQDIKLGHNLRRLRKNQGLTQGQVAVKLQLANIDMSSDFYAHIEAGSYNIRVSELVALRAIFECEYNDFFKEIE